MQADVAFEWPIGLQQYPNYYGWFFPPPISPPIATFIPLANTIYHHFFIWVNASIRLFHSFGRLFFSVSKVIIIICELLFPNPNKYRNTSSYLFLLFKPKTKKRPMALTFFMHFNVFIPLFNISILWAKSFHHFACADKITQKPLYGNKSGTIITKTL